MHGWLQSAIPDRTAPVANTRDPKVLTIPDAAWINQPAAAPETEPARRRHRDRTSPPPPPRPNQPRRN